MLRFDIKYDVATKELLLNSPVSPRQLSHRVCALLRNHHTPQPAAAPGRSKDGRASGRRPAEDGSPAEQEQPQVPGHHHRLSATAVLWKPGEQGKGTIGDALRGLKYTLYLC